MGAITGTFLAASSASGASARLVPRPKCCFCSAKRHGRHRPARCLRSTIILPISATHWPRPPLDHILVQPSRCGCAPDRGFCPFLRRRRVDPRSWPPHLEYRARRPSPPRPSRWASWPSTSWARRPSLSPPPFAWGSLAFWAPRAPRAEQFVLALTQRAQVFRWMGRRRTAWRPPRRRARRLSSPGIPRGPCWDSHIPPPTSPLLRSPPRSLSSPRPPAFVFRKDCVTMATPDHSATSPSDIVVDLKRRVEVLHAKATLRESARDLPHHAAPAYAAHRGRCATSACRCVRGEIVAYAGPTAPAKHDGQAGSPAC